MNGSAPPAVVVPILVVLGGLPGVGKSTLARALSARLGAAYLRIDTIEEAVRQSGAGPVGEAGYAVGTAVARDNLDAGLSVVADCVNPVAESRLAWRRVAAGSAARLAEIEVVCSDQAEHRRRVESRLRNAGRTRQPDWNSVLQHDYEPWGEPHLVVDSATSSPEQMLAACLAAIAQEE